MASTTDDDEEGDDGLDEDNEHEHEEEEQGSPPAQPTTAARTGTLSSQVAANARASLLRPPPFVQANPLCRPVVLHGMCL